MRIRLSASTHPPSSRFEEFEEKWSGYLGSEDCPPVPGLTPLQDHEAKEISDAIAEKILGQSGPQWRTLFTLMEEYPACLSVWLARKAGEAYEAGAFWEQFGELLGIPIPSIKREEFAQRFRRATFATMTTWLPPVDLGGHNIVAQFLHQAGLPLDRCRGFAELVRKVERSQGLPDLDEPDAGEQLREAVLDNLNSVTVPTLKRALRGPAGARICEVALRVVLKGEFSDINPRLGQELEHVFQHAPVGTLQRSAHQPFLRLGEDLTSIEIVGPRQDSSLVGANGLTWLVDGQRFPTPRTDDFVYVVTDKPRLTLEMSGLVLGSQSRTFVLRLDDLPEPFLLFDERTRRQRRATQEVPPGTYWLLHRANDNVIGALQTYEFGDNQRAVSLVQVGPRAGATLEDGTGRSWQFKPMVTPFLETVGEHLAEEGGSRVHFGWNRLPYVWLPAEEGQTERIDQWAVYLGDTNANQVCQLSILKDESDGMVKCTVEAGDFLSTLSPGLHRIGMSLRRGTLNRAEAEGHFWFWSGLRAYDGKEFTLDLFPTNLLPAECKGFKFSESTIRHLNDHNRKHRLVFHVDDEIIIFHWSQPGLFLEALDRQAGHASHSQPHHLGDSFAATLNSSRWLRIWFPGNTEWEVLIAGQIWQRSIANDSRSFVDLSLASLAITFPQGGEIKVKLGGVERLVARFSKPLQALTAKLDEGVRSTGFCFSFPESVVWVRPVLLNLVSGERRHLTGKQLINQLCMFGDDEFPLIECSVHDALDNEERGSNPLTFRTIKSGWPEGLWIIELEVRRDENAEWEPVLVNGARHAPVVIHARGDEATLAARAQLLWASLDGTLSNSQIDDTLASVLLDLLVDMINLRRMTLVSSARANMAWLKDAVRLLSKLAGRVARETQSQEFQTRLVNLACQDMSHAGFVHLPSLLALPANRYRELPSGDPLHEALRNCGKLSLGNSVLDLIQDDWSLLDVQAMSCFANFGELAQGGSDELLQEFNNFDHSRYLQTVLGTFQRERLISDWAGGSLLGNAHLVFALTELVRRYDEATRHNDGSELNLGAANKLLNCAPRFRVWLQSRLSSQQIMSERAWNAPWPQFIANEDFLEKFPRFASLFALAARAAAADLITFDDVLTWLERQVEHRWMGEDGIAALVRLGPEIFGYQLIFWELILRTRPHGNDL